MDLDGYVALAGLLVGFVVGLTGMGGGALMTPILVVVFGVQPLTAVSSDLAAAVIMKPIGGGVHLRRGTVHLGLVRWLCIGSVPSAFAGVLILQTIGGGKDLQDTIKLALGIALLLAAVTMVVKTLMTRRRGADVHRWDGTQQQAGRQAELEVAEQDVAECSRADQRDRLDEVSADQP